MAESHYMNYCLMLFLLWLTPALILRYIIKKTTKSTEPNTHLRRRLLLPPGPTAIPIIGHLHLLRPVAFHCFHNLSSKYGPLIYLRLGSRPTVLISSASFATEIFRTHDVAFSARPQTPFEDFILFGNSSFINAPYGDYWRFMKKLCVTKLLGIRQLESSRGVRHEERLQFVHVLLRKACTNEVVDVHGELTKLTNNAICRTAMGTTYVNEDDDTERCRKLVQGTLITAGKLAVVTMLGPLKKVGFWLCGKEVMDLTRRIDELFEKIVKEHEEKRRDSSSDSEYKDLIDILLQIQADDNAEVKITRNHIKAFIMDLFFAGTGSLADAMQWGMAELINHPHIFRKVREETESVVGANRITEESDIPRLPFLQAVVKEVLRLHPPGAVVPRVCLEDCKVGGFDIPKGTTIIINAYTIMRDPSAWNDPNQFHPERFLVSPDKEQEFQINGQNVNFIPFGAGRRMCPGATLAFNTIAVTLAIMVQCFDWKVDGNEKWGDNNKVNMQSGPGVSKTMAYPLRCRPVIHFNPFAV